MSTTDNFKIIAVSPSLIQIEVVNSEKFKEDVHEFSIGSYLKISDDSNTSIIALVQSYKIKDININASEQTEIKLPSFILDAQPIGFLDRNGKFRRGGQQIAIPPSHVQIATPEDLRQIYSSIDNDKKFAFSLLAQNESIEVGVDGDKFFSKHVAIVGSTGSGKSGTVSRILQEGIEPDLSQKQKGILNNTHIILFDLHGEYSAAFPKAKVLDVDNLILPYWLMNSEELEEMFIESNENNSHNQISQFKHAVTLNKKKHNSFNAKVNYDTPVYFNIREVCKYIHNQNIATKDAKTGEIKIKERIEGLSDEHHFFTEITFEEKISGKINNGPYAGEFDRFVPRLETKVADERLSFLLQPRNDSGDEYKTEHLEFIIQQLIGYINSEETNITIIDLSGIPFEVLSIVVSLISRIIFDFCFHLKSVKTVEIPFLLVLEEAHNYIPNSTESKYKSVKKSIERIAKEGRKYGLSLMIVSQRPSEISETIFSQCNNFVVMRLTNPSDQNYVKKLLPDNVSNIIDTLPTLEKREAIIIGDSILVPSIVKIKELTNKPNSHDIEFRTEWKKDWAEFLFTNVISKLIKFGNKKEICENS